MIKALDEGKFEVLGKSKVHKVDFGIGLSAPACTCKDWEAYRIPCKHFFAIFNWFPEWGWEKLPQTYQNSPYLCLDDDAIARYLQDQHDTNETQPLTPRIIGEPISTEPEPNYPEPNDAQSTES